MLSSVWRQCFRVMAIRRDYQHFGISSCFFHLYRSHCSSFPISRIQRLEKMTLCSDRQVISRFQSFNALQIPQFWPISHESLCSRRLVNRRDDFCLYSVKNEFSWRRSWIMVGQYWSYLHLALTGFPDAINSLFFWFCFKKELISPAVYFKERFIVRKFSAYTS